MEVLEFDTFGHGGPLIFGKRLGEIQGQGFESARVASVEVKETFQQIGQGVRFSLLEGNLEVCEMVGDQEAGLENVGQTMGGPPSVGHGQIGDARTK